MNNLLNCDTVTNCNTRETFCRAKLSLADQHNNFETDSESNVRVGLHKGSDDN